MDNPTILIVDDEVEINIKLLRNILENEGFNVLEAHNGPDARAISRKKLPDLILLDIIMPEEDGYITCQKLKEDFITADIPVIFISAISDSISKIKGFNLGAVDYITKPFDQAEVLARTKIHLKLSSAIKTIIQNQAKRLQGLKKAQLDTLVTPADRPDAKFSVFYKTLYEAGGDFYDVKSYSKDIYGYFCADVCGHDLGASLATSSFKALLPQNTGLLYSPVDSLKMINSVLNSVLPEDNYLTAIYAKLNRKNGKIEIANAGHTSAIYQPISGNARIVESSGDILGMFDTMSIDSIVIDVSKGDRLFLYTDGIIESDGENYISRTDGLNRVMKVLDETNSMKLDLAVNYVISKLFPDLSNISDDILLLGVDV